ncbi:hypothetical protein [Sulfurimonas marina]|uniref:Uncharacterized protein n=1 Tax=Sulfurimonas marina TaxID=2590551 RepID=A0A7M1AUX8_9BACT|nr:hypothetical protein [Sulfurimonas marina]QOP41237.1 hypothetical protein FJR03_05565 [Sulfurimonas marina]
MTFEQSWIEYDYNPFILFNANGKIISLNAEAQFLLGIANPNELFELAQTYASISFGFKTTFVQLEYGRYRFFGITVGYEDEEQIGIKLYQAPSYKLDAKKPDGQLTNIYTILDLCISSNSINSPINYTKTYDPTIPEVILESNSIIKLLNKTYSYFSESETIDTKVFYRIGEHIKFDGKKYSIFSIEITGDQTNPAKEAELKAVAENYNFYLDASKTAITINIPMITS